jgi:hypothetical protein
VLGAHVGHGGTSLSPRLEELSRSSRLQQHFPRSAPLGELAATEGEEEHQSCLLL